MKNIDWNVLAFIIAWAVVMIVGMLSGALTP